MLRDEAERVKKPATSLAREAIEAWLRDRQRVAVHEAIAAYAARHVASPLDLDRDLEAAGLESWRPVKRQRRR